MFTVFSAILIKSLKADPTEIYKWLIDCNTDKLSPASLEQLEKCLPEDKIIMKYQEFKENIDVLDSSEKFLVIVSFRNELIFTQEKILLYLNLRPN